LSIVLATCTTKIILSATSACFFSLRALRETLRVKKHAKTAKNRGARKASYYNQALRELCVFFLRVLCVKNLFSVHAKVMRHLNTNFYFGCLVFSKYSRNNYLHT
jgi:hypothetical protein